MKQFKQAHIALIAISAICLSTTASAIPTIGVTVDNFTNTASVGSTQYRSALGGDAIKYYIPLGNTDCTYGINGCGTSSDTGNGGGTLSMNIMFSPVDSVASTLSINFEDLDLIGANDPYGFFESVQVFDSSGNALTSLITDISSGMVMGDALTQQLLNVDLGVLSSDTYFTTLKFNADFYTYGRNTPEYLIASIDQTTVPEPSTLLLLCAGILGIGITGRRNKKA